MNHLIEALETSINTQNWYSVLFISLTLPDICGKIDQPNEGSAKRTINWFNKYLKQIYTSNSEHLLLSGSDFYALRCAYLHEGNADITNQRAREILDNFRFVQPLTDEICLHNIHINNTLLLQVDLFGKDVLNALKQWEIKNSQEIKKYQDFNNILKIEFVDPLKGISIF